MPKGKVKYWNPTRQFGFISAPDGNGKDIFFGRRSLNTGYDVTIDRDTLVEYELGTDNQGRTAATSVRPTEDAAR
jgi:cold shock CspA family protein